MPSDEENEISESTETEEEKEDFSPF